MSVIFNIAITKEILRQSKNCSNKLPENGNNCAIAIALKDIFPDVYVAGECLYPFGNSNNAYIPLPVVARQFIKLFDGFHMTPALRLLLPAFEFSIEIHDEIINMINIDDLNSVINPSVTISDSTHGEGVEFAVLP